MKKELELTEKQTDDAYCEPTVRLTLNSKQTDYAKQLFAALADETRLTILNLLAESDGEVCVCDITASFKLGQPTISHHLKILRDAGFIKGEKRGKWVYYSLVAGRAEEVEKVLDRVLGGKVLVF